MKKREEEDEEEKNECLIHKHNSSIIYYYSVFNLLLTLIHLDVYLNDNKCIKYFYDVFLFMTNYVLHF